MASEAAADVADTDLKADTSMSMNRCCWAVEMVRLGGGGMSKGGREGAETVRCPTAM